MNPTEEQAAILELVRTTKSNILINAYAGTGKTTMLRMIERQLRSRVLYLVFNKRNKEEAEFITQRQWLARGGDKSTYSAEAGRRMLETTDVKTINGFGHAVWTHTVGTLTLDKDKTRNTFREEIEALSDHERGEAWEGYWEIIKAVGLAKSLGYLPRDSIHPVAFPTAKGLSTQEFLTASLDEEPTELQLYLINRILIRSIHAAYKGAVDFDDQVYMPALFGGTFPQYPVVLVDERQDFSPVNDAMLHHFKRSRIIAVGDPNQGIYGFRGAMYGSMAKFKSDFDAIEAELTTCFRCPENIVENARWKVPQMKSTRSGGRIARLRNPHAATFPDGCAIVCRNNAPLFSLALKLLSAGRSVSVSGSDIGPRVIGILKKLGEEDLAQEKVYEEIEHWRTEKLQRKSTTANDIADCMRVFAGYGRTLGAAIEYASHLFDQSGTIHLLTGHKAKGLEWPVVYHLDPGLIRQDAQDLNLRYVIQTRAREEYYEIDSREIQ